MGRSERQVKDGTDSAETTGGAGTGDTRSPRKSDRTGRSGGTDGNGKTDKAATGGKDSKGPKGPKGPKGAKPGKADGAGSTEKRRRTAKKAAEALSVSPDAAEAPAALPSPGTPAALDTPKTPDDSAAPSAPTPEVAARLPRPRSDPDAPPRADTEPAIAEPAVTEPAVAGPAAVEPPFAPVSFPPRTAGDVLLDHLRAEAAEFLAQAPRVREGGEDAAHRMRVAARRMRSALRTCKSLVEPGPAQALSLELRWAADSLAGERDNEVLLERLLAAFETLPARSGTPRARAAVERRLRGGLASGHTTALRAIDSPDFGTLGEQLSEPGLGLEFTRQAARPAAKTVPRLAAKAFRTLATGAEALPLAHAAVAYNTPVPLSGEDDEAWHRVRILGKRARYAADLCAPEFGASAKSLAKRMKAVTESLGTHQDAALAAEVVRELALSPRLGGAAAFVLGELYTVQRFAVAEARFTFASVWPPLRDRLDEVELWGS
ncbi:CHAD domain-containing protein [Streptodolium elevatio]